MNKDRRIKDKRVRIDNSFFYNEILLNYKNRKNLTWCQLSKELERFLRGNEIKNISLPYHGPVV